jgi:hypothetical protein
MDDEASFVFPKKKQTISLIKPGNREAAALESGVDQPGLKKGI